MRVRPVLTVEAAPALRTHLKGLLEEWGYEPIGVGSVDEALAALATSQFEFSLVDMDLDGSDGIHLLHRLKQQGGDPGPIILLFDPPDTKRIADAAALGADDFLQKPFKPEELENAIKA
ncbi:MAG TPA: response regulator, partial [Vicinamibacteria bacterium]|nr:response regulator [Vicinamibacteria bacterium]